jgi:hypothetical protein
MPYLLERHKVCDYDRWRGVFDAYSAGRALVGVQLPTALRTPGLCPALEDLILGYLLAVRVSNCLRGVR